MNQTYYSGHGGPKWEQSLNAGTFKSGAGISYWVTNQAEPLGPLATDDRNIVHNFCCHWSEVLTAMQVWNSKRNLKIAAKGLKRKDIDWNRSIGNFSRRHAGIQERKGEINIFSLSELFPSVRNWRRNNMCILPSLRRWRGHLSTTSIGSLSDKLIISFLQLNSWFKKKKK